MTQNLPVPVDDLPMSLVDIAETLGMGVALKLMAHFGGLEVQFPRVPPPDHPVIVALGETDGYALCELLSGVRISVPHGRPQRVQRTQIVAMERRGLDRAAIARALGITQRHVRRVANSAAGDHRQISMFDDD